MVNVEELDPAPLIARMNTMGLVTRIKHGDIDQVLEPHVAPAKSFATADVLEDLKYG